MLDLYLGGILPLYKAFVVPHHHKKPVNKAKSTQESTIRIIAGHWRGRKIKVLCEDGLRPTGDRLREVLFNWLMADINGARILDLFAGTGALGLEALSRGAKSADFVESNIRAATQLKATLTALASGSEQSQIQWRVHSADANKWVSNDTSSPAPFDIVFIDPPFADDLWQTSLEALSQSSVLKHGTLIYIEHPSNVQPSMLPELHLKKSKRAGSVTMNLYEYLNTRHGE